MLALFALPSWKLEQWGNNPDYSNKDHNLWDGAAIIYSFDNM